MMNYFQKKKLAFMSIVNRVKGFVRTITGALPLTLEGCVDEESIIDYTLYGQSVQNGTPTPDTPIEVESVGEKTRNLFAPDVPHEQGFLNASGNGIIKNKDFPHIQVFTIAVKPNTTYSYNGVILNNTTYTLLNSDMEYLGNYGGNISSKQNITFETTSDTSYVQICSSLANFQKGILYFNEGEQYIEEPYYEGYKIPIKVSGNGETVTTNIYLDEPLRKVGDYADYIKSVDLKTGKGTVARKVGVNKLLANSNISFTKASTGSSTMNRYFYTPKPVIKSAQTSKGVGYCTVLRKDYEVWNAWTKPQIYFSMANNSIGIVIPIDIKYSYSAIYNYLSNNGENEVVIYYQLETPTETPITLPPIPTFKGTSIISADTTVQPSNAEIEYYSNVKE